MANDKGSGPPDDREKRKVTTMDNWLRWDAGSGGSDSSGGDAAWEEATRGVDEGAAPPEPDATATVVEAPAIHLPPMPGSDADVSELTMSDLEPVSEVTVRPVPVPPPPSPPVKAEAPRKPSMPPMPPPPPPASPRPAPPAQAARPPAAPPPPAARPPAPGPRQPLKLPIPAPAGERAARSRPAAPPMPRLAEVPEAVPTLEEGAAQVAELIRRELARGADDLRAARLHHDLAVVLEHHLGDLAGAAEHYAKALERLPEHRPSLAGARRVLLALDRPKDALPLFDAELKLIGDPRRRAALLVAKGAVYEHRLDMVNEAREAYRAALDLDGRDVATIKALERCDRRREAWQALSSDRERLGNAVDDDEAYRAALLASRAFMAEARLRDTDGAAALYQAALSLDARAPVAVSSLKRLHRAGKRWHELIATHRLELDLSATPATRVAALRSIARLSVERLGDESEAAAALEAASAEAPGDASILQELVDLYTEADRVQGLASALERLYAVTRDEARRCQVAHRLGQIHEAAPLGDEIAARRGYEAALAIDPGFRPSLDALGLLLERSQDWAALIQMHLREIDATADEAARAATHARIAEVLEVKLGRADEAAAHYTAALGLVPDHESSFKALTRLHAEAGRWRELAELYQRVVDRSPGQERSVSYLLRIGAIFEDRLDDPAGAAHWYQRVLEISPDHLGAIQATQRAAERAGDHALLVRMLEREAKLEPRIEVKAALLCRAAEASDRGLGDVEAAIGRLRRVLKLDPAQPDALRALSRILRREGRWDDLLRNQQAELQREPAGPRRARLLHAMGEVCETHLGQEKDAIGYYRQALAAAPDHGPSYEALARLLRARESYAELAKLLEQRLERAPTPELALEVARLYEEQLDNPALALSFHARALEAAPGLQTAIDGRDRLLHGAGKWRQLADALAAEAEATTDETRAIEARMEEALVRLHRLGDRAAAAASFEWVLERCPDHRGALLALEELYQTAGDVEALAEVYRRQAELLTSVGARIAALRELARFRTAAGLHDEARDASQRILEIDPRDEAALEALAQSARDPGEALGTYTRLAEVTDDPGLRAASLARIAALLEGWSSKTALLDAYRAALELDPDSLVMTRGLTRAARRAGDPRALYQAALCEARTTRDLRTAVMLLEESARLRLATNDLDGAAADLEKALELDPGHRLAAEALAAVLVRLDQVPRLIELLARAADLVPDRTRRAELHLEIAELHASHLQNLPAAVASSRRALVAAPGHLPALLRLARDLEDNGQWQEAAEALGVVIASTRDADALAGARLRLAAVLDERLGEPDRAAAALEAVLATDPGHGEALFRLARLEASRGKSAQALERVRRLLDQAASDADRTAALRLLAHVEGLRGGHEEAAQALLEAISLEGAGGVAAQAYRQLLDDGVGAATWDAYLGVLEAHAERARAAGAPAGPTHRAAAEALADRLGRLDQAIATLRRGLEREPDDLESRLQLARRLRESGAREAALAELRRIFERDVAQADAWRQLAALHRAAGDEREALAALQPLKLLEAAAPEELVEVMARQPRPLRLPEGLSALLSLEGIAELRTDPALAPTTALVAALAPVLAKLHPFDLGRRGADRPVPAMVRAVADEVARALGVTGVDVVVDGQAAGDVVMEQGRQPVLVAPEWASGLSRPGLIFLLARALTNVAREVHVVHRASAHELSLTLSAATRLSFPAFRVRSGLEAEVEERSKEVARVMPRRSRKPVAAAAEAWAARAPADLEAWVRAVHRTAARAALLLADDLGAAAQVVRTVTGGADTLRHQGGAAADLVRFWASDAAARARKG